MDFMAFNKIILPYIHNKITTIQFVRIEYFAFYTIYNDYFTMIPCI